MENMPGAFLKCVDHPIQLISRIFSPGRFFATVELKAMLAHIVTSYDVKMEEEGVRPPNQWFAGVCIPSKTAQVLFRRRCT
jgi:hypothetical protein